MAGHTLQGADGVAKALEAIAKRMGGGEVAVGFMEGATYPDGTPVAAVAFASFAIFGAHVGDSAAIIWRKNGRAGVPLAPNSFQ